MRNRVPEKAKNFKGAIVRLFKELNSYKILIIISIIAAIFSSVLSIISPNRLSKLTDEISLGLSINKDNMTLILTNVQDSMSEEKVRTLVYSFMNSGTLVTNYDSSLVIDYSKLTDEQLKYIFPDAIYNDVFISSEDKINFIKNKVVSESIGNILFTPFEVDGVVITTSDQTKFINLISDLGTTNDASLVYSRIESMPENILNVINPHMNLNNIKNIAILLIIIYILSAVLHYVESVSMVNVSNKFAYRLRKNISNKINILPLKYFDKHLSGDTLSRVTNDVDTISQNLNNSLATLVSAITLFLGTTIMMFVTNVPMAITAILSSLLGFSFMAVILSKSQKYFAARQTELGNLNGHIEEVYSSLNVVKAYNGEKLAKDEFENFNNKVCMANKKSQFLSGLMIPMMGFIGNLGYVAVCIVGALLVMNNKISFGVIVAFITYVRLFTSPLSQIAQALTSMQSTAAASERVFEFLDEEEMKKERSKHIKNVKGEIEFDNVSFTYDGNDKPTIKNFTAKAKPGEKIAIVGPTGAGKTTMVNLLMKFYEISSGDIKIDGMSTKDLARDDIHRLFTMVLQDTWLFDGTIRDNIVYNRPNVTDKQVMDVCKIVGLDHFIKTLPNGLDTNISENDSISAGQKQLLTIARGMIESSPFLILDEATSNVDTRTEELVQKAMDKLTEGKTSFIIAHRLSTIKNADLILVMKDGNIIETGNHDELMKQKGFYSELYNSQFEL